MSITTVLLWSQIRFLAIDFIVSVLLRIRHAGKKTFCTQGLGSTIAFIEGVRHSDDELFGRDHLFVLIVRHQT